VIPIRTIRPKSAQMTSYSKFVPYVMKELQVCLRDNGSCYMDIGV